MFLDISSFTKKAYTAINDMSETTIVSIPSIACLYWSEFNDPIIFKVAAIRTIAAPIATILADMAPKLRAPDPNLEDSIERTSITAIIAVNTPINVDNIATASHSLSGSINVNTTILPTKIAMDIAIFLIAFALILNAKDFRTLESPIKVFPIPFADSSNTFPAPESTSPSPLSGLANESTASAIFLIVATIPRLTNPANTEFQSMLFMASIALVPIVLIAFQTVEVPF